ncbi:MAG: phospholipid methyltransferase [Proteobacteria bacterium]|nr:phospholipid methyltransferase [Pseudomonadota bacterium]
MKKIMIKIGDFFFKYRNHLFPLILTALYLISVPPHDFFGNEKLENLKDILAVLIAASGLALRALVIGYAYIKRGGLQKKVYAENLVTQGVFSACRNPLYVGNVLICIGIFLMHGSPIVLSLGITIYLFIYQCIIFAEERYLREKFGKAYDAYCNDTPRWLVKVSVLPEALSGMKFNFKRVIMKDYTTIANTIVLLAITELYEDYSAIRIGGMDGYNALLCLLIVTSIIMVIAVRTAKKKHWLTEA